MYLLMPSKITCDKLAGGHPGTKTVTYTFDILGAETATRLQGSGLDHKALPTGIPVSGPPPASIITPYTISATRLLRMHSMLDLG